MVFSNALLVFMISLQFGMYDLMIDNTLKSFTGHVQVQAPGYKDEQKIRQVVPGADALADPMWADDTRARLEADAARLDALVTGKGAVLQGGTALFRLDQVQDAAAAQAHLARHQIWSRIFPYADNWLRLGLPGPGDWPRVEAAF